ncbi:ABC transporter permease [Nonomuraea sp. NPDC050328]|uniref:ABC transporter permease n=1 Tax=Nonomuraea sp. NPDC050328 TaxID=3364361 RepID=UPI00378BE234
MIVFILRRLLSGVILIFAISVIAFTLLYVGSGDIARRIVGVTASEEIVARKTLELGLNRPLADQYLNWLAHAVTGDLGRSWFTSQPVTDALAIRLGVTLSIVLGATVLSAILAVALGVWSAVRGGPVDRAVQMTSFIGRAIPGFLIALALVWLFAHTLLWFSPTGYVRITDSFTGWLSTVTLPILALAVGGVATIAQQVRGSVLDVLRQDYVRTLRSRGLSARRTMYRHVLRNAAGPALVVTSLQFIGLLGGAVIVEQVFAIPGLGQVAFMSSLRGDIPLVMGLVIITAILVLTVNLVIDLVQGWLNPKVRLS